MEAKILDLQHSASACKCGTDSLWIIRKDSIARRILSLHDCPGLGRVLESAKLRSIGRMLKISHDSGLSACVVVAEQQPCNFTLAPCRMDGKPHDVPHRDAGAPFLPLAEVLRKSPEFLSRRSPGSLLRFRNELLRFHDLTGVIDDTEVDRQSPGCTGVTEDDSQPDKVVVDRRGTGTGFPALSYMLNQIRRRKSS